MCAWMVESFPVSARYTAVAIGYNSAHACIGGLTLVLCTYLSTNVNVMAPGWVALLHSPFPTVMIGVNRTFLCSAPG